MKMDQGGTLEEKGDEVVGFGTVFLFNVLDYQRVGRAQDGSVRPAHQ